MIKDAPKIDASKLVDPLSTKLYDKNGNFLYEYGKEKRTKIKYSQVPKMLEHAFIATEDAHFYEHNGIDIKGTARAIFKNLKGISDLKEEVRLHSRSLKTPFCHLRKQ